MWICSKHGFYSIVFKKDYWMLRGRVRKDLENLKAEVGLDNEIIETTDSDYRYRLILTKEQYHQIMVCLEESVDYGNFKDMINRKPDQRDKPYHQIWQILADQYGCYGWDMQGEYEFWHRFWEKHDENKPKPKRKKTKAYDDFTDYSDQKPEPKVISAEERQGIVSTLRKVQGHTVQTQDKDKSGLSEVNDGYAYRKWLYAHRQ